MSNLHHTSYEKIGEDFHKWKLTEADYRCLKKTDWVVTEKIHGANFCILTDGKTIKYAKRKEILADDEDFFGHTQLVKELKPKFLAVFSIIKQIYPQIEQISIYGELFGGRYPHPDVKPNLSVNTVQTGIYYSANIEFIVFDIAYETQKLRRDYLDCEQLATVCSQSDIMYTHALFVGKYEEALAYNIEFTTTIPTLLGLPPLDINNKAEGIVIKPAQSFFIDTPKGKLRPVLKRKIAEFAEDERFHQAQKWQYQKLSKLELNESFIETKIFSLITENRLNNVISKLGAIEKMNKKRKQKIIDLYIEDVWESFQDNWEELFDQLETEQKAKIVELIKQKLEKLLPKKI